MSARQKDAFEAKTKDRLQRLPYDSTRKTCERRFPNYDDFRQQLFRFFDTSLIVVVAFFLRFPPETPRLAGRVIRRPRPGESCYRTLNRVLGKEQFDTVEVPSARAFHDRIEQRRDPLFARFESARAHRASKNIERLHVCLYLGHQRPCVLVARRTRVAIPELHVVAESDETHPRPMLRVLHFSAVNHVARIAYLQLFSFAELLEMRRLDATLRKYGSHGGDEIRHLANVRVKCRNLFFLTVNSPS